MWWTNFMPENWGMLLFTEKAIETDAGARVSDQDADTYYIDLSYKADFGNTVAALLAGRNATFDADQTYGPYTTTVLWLNGNYTFGNNWGLEWEADIGFGDSDNDTNRKSYGFMVDLDYAMNDWTFGGLFIYETGDSDPTDNDNESSTSNLAGTGKDYNPYQIMMGDYMNMWNGDNPLAPTQGINNALKQPNPNWT
jgi:hypothetical protein